MPINPKRTTLPCSSSWWRTPSRALPYWRLVAKYPYLLPSSMLYGPQTSGAGHPCLLFSARWPGRNWENIWIVLHCPQPRLSRSANSATTISGRTQNARLKSLGMVLNGMISDITVRTRSLFNAIPVVLLNTKQISDIFAGQTARNNSYNFLALHGLIMYWSLFSISMKTVFCASGFTETTLAPHVADA